jgi:hypothetical protein
LYPELLKVISVMAKPIIAMCSAAFARLEGIAFTSKEKLALSLLFAVLFAVKGNTL